MYVYDQRKINGRVITEYNGPLDRLVRSYRIINTSLQDNHWDLNMAIDMLVEKAAWEVVNL